MVFFDFPRLERLEMERGLFLVDINGISYLHC